MVARVTSDAVDQHRQMELDRLDALQAALWGKAMAGDAAAVQAVLRVIERRCRLLGLDVSAGPSPAGGGGSVVDPSYWETLKAQGGPWPPATDE